MLYFVQAALALHTYVLHVHNTLFLLVFKTCPHICRGRRAIEESTQRLSKAMDRADAELASAQRSQRGSRPLRHAANGQAVDGHNRQNAYEANGHSDGDDAGIHKLGRAAEGDYDR